MEEEIIEIIQKMLDNNGIEEGGFAEYEKEAIIDTMNGYLKQKARADNLEKDYSKILTKVDELEADLYVANNIIAEHIDIVKKQEKMIELMSRFIDTELSSEHLSKVLKIDVKPLETYREDIKQYFKKKAEESE